MPLDPETIAAIQQAIKDVVPAVVAESVKPISEQLELVQHNNAKLAESVSGLSQSIPEQIDGKFSAITPKLDYLEQLKLKQESEEADKPKKQTEIQKAISEVSSQYEQQLTQFRQELETEKAEAAKLRESDRQSRMRNDVLATMRGMKSIIPGTEEQVLILLESQGLIVEDGDKLRIKTEDKFKQPVNADFGEALPGMLEKQFAHFAIPRGGTGTDGQPGNPTPASSQYDFASMTAQQVHETCANNPEARKELDRILEDQYK